MYLWFMSNPDLTHELIAGRQERSDAMVRITYRIVSGGAAAASQLARLAERFGQAYGRWQRRRVGLRTLQSLDDRLLSDIGIARGDIRRVVEETADQGPMTIPELAQLEAQREVRFEAGRKAERRAGRGVGRGADRGADGLAVEEPRLAA